jgi:hypothetical protein
MDLDEVVQRFSVARRSAIFHLPLQIIGQNFNADAEDGDTILPVMLCL